MEQITYNVFIYIKHKKFPPDTAINGVCPC